MKKNDEKQVKLLKQVELTYLYLYLFNRLFAALRLEGCCDLTANDCMLHKSMYIHAHTREEGIRPSRTCEIAAENCWTSEVYNERASRLKVEEERDDKR